MTATRTAEFAAGTGTAVVVDTKRMLHKDPRCPRATNKQVGTYATERTARSAIPNVKACRHCR